MPSQVDEEALTWVGPTTSQQDGKLAKIVKDAESTEVGEDDGNVASIFDVVDGYDKIEGSDKGIVDKRQSEASLFDLMKKMESRVQELEQEAKKNKTKQSTTADSTIYGEDLNHGDEMIVYDKNFGDNDDYGEVGKDEEEPMKYPETCFSFIALNGPKKDGSWPMERKINFVFGLVPFCFQMALLLLLAVSQTNELHGTIGESDNPDAGKDQFIALLASFTPANATPIIRVAQMISIAAYVFFPGESLQDVLRAVQLFPLSIKKKMTEPVRSMRFACLLQLMAGLTAMIVTIFLVLTSNTVVDIILNFTAVNFISDLDEAAFSLAKEGELLSAFEREAKRISEKELPDCMIKYKPTKKSCKLFVSCFLYGIAFGMMAFVFASQNSTKVWVTGTLRVQFQDETGLDSYSGCYGMNTDPKSIQFSRRTYHSFDTSISNTSFGYCREERQWILYRGNATNPCDAAANSQLLLARSSKTDNFDISTSFDESWFSASNTPLEMYFFDGDDEEEIEDHCDSFLGDGKCDPFFNTLGFQYDGGDCCAATCTDANCGRGGLMNVFGEPGVSGDGFQNCSDPSMLPITIYLNDIASNRDSKFTGLDLKSFDLGIFEDYDWEDIPWVSENDVYEWMGAPPVNPYFALDCNGKNVMTAYIQESMVNKSQTVMVEDGATCTLVIRNKTTEIDIFEDDPIWLVDYTIFQGGEDSRVEIRSNSSSLVDSITFSRIPVCYFQKLRDFNDLAITYSASRESSSSNAIEWLLEDDTGNSKCEDFSFIERYALVDAFYAMKNKTTTQATKFLSRDRQCTWPSVTCEEGRVTKIDLQDAGLTGDLSSALSLLKDLSDLQLCEKIDFILFCILITSGNAPVLAIARTNSKLAV